MKRTKCRRNAKPVSRPLVLTFKKLGLLAGPCARTLASLVHLTPQRCEVMFRLREGPMIQRDLAFELGVVRSVVSKMVTALEKLGIVERRAVPEDRRLRLVTLTQRAFDLMSLLLEHAPFDDQGNGLQCAAEHQLLHDFAKPLRAQKTGVARLSPYDHRALLATMRASVFGAPPERWLDLDYEMPHPTEIARVHRSWRASRAEWREHHVDAQIAKAHQNVGPPLDFWQRFPRRRRASVSASGATSDVA